MAVYKKNGISYKLPGRANRLSDYKEHKLIKDELLLPAGLIN